MDQPPLNLPEGFPPDMPLGLPSMPFAMPSELQHLPPTGMMMGVMSSASPMWQQGVHSARAHLGMFDQTTSVRAKRTREASVFESGSGRGSASTTRGKARSNRWSGSYARYGDVPTSISKDLLLQIDEQNANAWVTDRWNDTVCKAALLVACGISRGTIQVPQ